MATNENTRPNNLGGTWLIASEPTSIFKDAIEEMEVKAKLEKIQQMEANEPKARMLEAYDKNEKDKSNISSAQLAVMKRMFGI